MCNRFLMNLNIEQQLVFCAAVWKLSTFPCNRTVEGSLQQKWHCCTKQMKSRRNNTAVWAVHCWLISENWSMICGERDCTGINCVVSLYKYVVSPCGWAVPPHGCAVPPYRCSVRPYRCAVPFCRCAVSPYRCAVPFAIFFASINSHRVALQMHVERLLIFPVSFLSTAVFVRFEQNFNCKTSCYVVQVLNFNLKKSLQLILNC